MGKRWVSIELPYNTEETKRRCNLFKKFLKDNDIYFETSGVNDVLHFEIFCNKEQDFLINNAANRLVFCYKSGAV